jgi:drug/metabolite transporter (DMT)-like permease
VAVMVRSLPGARTSEAGTTAHRRHWEGVALALVAAIGFGFMPVLARVAYASGADLVTFLTLRFTIAGVVLWIWVFVTHQRVPSGRLLVSVLLLSTFGYVLQSYTFFSAVRYADVAIVAAVAYTYPIFVMLLAVATKRDRVTPLKAFALLGAVVGVVLLVATVSTQESRLLGIALAGTAGLIYAVYLTVSERVIPDGYATGSAAVIIATAGVVYWLGLLWQGEPEPPTELAGWAALIGVALGSTVISITALLAALQRLKPVSTATVAAAEPVVSVLLALVWLHETLGILQWIGLAMIVASVVTVARKSHPTQTVMTVRGPY